MILILSNVWLLFSHWLGVPFVAGTMGVMLVRSCSAAALPSYESCRVTFSKHPCLYTTFTFIIFCIRISLYYLDASLLSLLRTYSHEESGSGLNSRNASYHSVQNLVSSRLLSKNVKIKISRNCNCLH
jgi:hypothetical protein